MADGGVTTAVQARAPVPAAAPSRATTRLGRVRVRTATLLLATFAVSRAVYWLLGVRFDASAISGRQGTGLLQLLDVRLLRTDLASSIWHLHSQPPLFNLYCGVLLHLPAGSRAPVAWLSFMGIGLLLVASTHQLLRELGATSFVATAVAVLVAVSPTYELYENFLFYAYPSAAFLTASGWMCARFLRTRQLRWGVGFTSTVTVVALTNSTYELPWVALAAAALVIVCWRAMGRRVLLALLPLLVFVGWLLRTEAMFGTFTTSSWLGMNLSNLTVRPAQQHGQLGPLEAQGTLDRYAGTEPWQPVSYYVPARDPAPHPTGIPALDLPTNENGQPNLNNSVYLQVSSRLLADDLRYIRARPGQYLSNATVGAMVWFAPPDQYAVVYRDWRHVRFLTDTVDRVVGWQPADGVDTTFADYGVTLRHPEAAQLSYSSLLEYTVLLLCTPAVVALRRRRLGAARVGALVFVWATIVYAFVLTSLVDVGENNRFRVELGALPFALSVVVGLELIRILVSRARRRRPPPAHARRARAEEGDPEVRIDHGVHAAPG
jgi:hypothetical protein